MIILDRTTGVKYDKWGCGTAFMTLHPVLVSRRLRRRIGGDGVRSKNFSQSVTLHPSPELAARRLRAAIAAHPLREKGAFAP